MTAREHTYNDNRLSESESICQYNIVGLLQHKNRT